MILFLAIVLMFDFSHGHFVFTSASALSGTRVFALCTERAVCNAARLHTGMLD